MVSDLLLKDYQPKSLLRRPAHIPVKAKFPVVDAHDHLFGDLPAEDLLRVMDEVGVRTFINVSGNATLPFDGQGYTIRRRDMSIFMDNHVAAFPGRFAAFTMSDFAQWDDSIFFKDDGFVDGAIQHMEEDVARGARGLKITKELGLRFTDRAGRMIPVDDDRLFPIWKRAGELRIPVLIHVSDPVAFFLPGDEQNEHYLTLQEFPGWGFQGAFYGKWELLEQRNRVIARHPTTPFILPHVANNPEDFGFCSLSPGCLCQRFHRLLGAHRRTGPPTLHSQRLLHRLPG